jgi:uncharacterized protein with GYD domain
MAYRIASKLTFTPAWGAMNADERMTEQVAALEIVAANGGEFEGQWVLWTDGVLLSIVNYPDLDSSVRSEMAISARGAFELSSQSALSLDEITALGPDA